MRGNDEQVVRFTLETTPAGARLLDELAAATGGTRDDVLSRALALLQLAVAAKRRGLKLGLANAEQPLTVEITGF